MSVEGAVQLLDQIYEDRTIPKNVREQCSSAKKILTDTGKEIKVRIDSALQIMDRLSEDPNIPVYARTQIWNIVSLLESV